MHHMQCVPYLLAPHTTQKMSTPLMMLVIVCVFLGPKAVANGITTAPLRKVLAAFFEKCPEQYTM